MKILERLDNIRKRVQDMQTQTLGKRAAEVTGFRTFSLEAQQYLAIAARQRFPSGSPLSLDLCCGLGGWAQFAAALGFYSYAIDINSFLINKAESLALESRMKGDLLPHTVCRFAVGNVHIGSNENQYRLHAMPEIDREVMPLVFGNNPYIQLGISLRDAQVIYGFVWPKHAPSFCTLLAEHTRPDTLFVLPMYTHECRSILPLDVIECTPGKGTALYKKRRLKP
ncbi:MAG: hypothetical protein AABY00_01560 [Nanoarchaeota archaeon]